MEHLLDQFAVLDFVGQLSHSVIACDILLCPFENKFEVILQLAGWQVIALKAH
ncbi:MAG TPA: hypothetical protein VNV61_11190 [Steroidobacteraceae bacterium]|nr:hypothetical protein [Steroidobacteraceae bacterium]